MAGDVRFRILGAVTAEVGDVPVALGGVKPAAVLAMLLLSANAPVATASLVDGLWDEVPTTGLKMLQMYVSALRRGLGDHEGRLTTTSRGYRLDVAADELDLTQALGLRDSAHATSDPRVVGRILREALALWSGPSLHGVRELPFATAAGLRLDELRTTLLDERIDADLAAGMHRDVVDELRGRFLLEPTHEHACTQLMLALYRSGRQAEALEAARALRTSLDRELGLLPGPAVLRLETSILNHDPELDLPSPLHVMPSTGRAEASHIDEGRRRLRVSRRGVVAAVVVGGLIAGLLVGADLFGGQGTTPPVGAVAVGPHSIAVIDAATDAVIRDVQLHTTTDWLAAAGDSAYAVNTALRTLTAIDLTRGGVGTVVGLPATPQDLAGNKHDVWVSDAYTGTVSQLDVSDHQLTAPFFPAGNVTGLVAIAADDSRLWAGLPDGRLVALNVSNLAPTATVRLGDRVRLLTDTDGSVCAGFFRAPSVICIRADTGARLATMKLPGVADGITTDADGVWALAGAPIRLWHRAFAAGSRTTSQPLDDGALAVTSTPGYVWVLLHDGQLLRQDSGGRGPVVSLDLGRPATALTTEGDRILVALS